MNKHINKKLFVLLINGILNRNVIMDNDAANLCDYGKVNDSPSQSNRALPPKIDKHPLIYFKVPLKKVFLDIFRIVKEVSR